MPGIDAHFRGQARMQRRGVVELTRFDLQAHRHALHYLDPVTGGIFRRQQRELGAGARTQARHPGPEAPARIGVDTDLGRLTGTHVGQIVFLEISFHPYVARGHQAEHRRRGIDVIPDLQLLDARHHAVIRRADHRV